MKLEVVLKDPRGNIEVVNENGKFTVMIEMEDVGGRFWESVGKFTSLENAMRCVANIIISNCESDFYEGDS